MEYSPDTTGLSRSLLLSRRRSSLPQQVQWCCGLGSIPAEALAWVQTLHQAMLNNVTENQNQVKGGQ